MKRVITFVLALCMALSCLCLPALAAVYASPTIAASSATLYKGSKSGQLKISYSVSSNVRSSSLGVATIELYKDTGEYVDTITGTTENGLVKNGNSTLHGGVYYYNDAEPGEYYYAEVTVFAVIDGVYDDYTHLTSTVRAPL